MASKLLPLELAFLSRSVHTTFNSWKNVAAELSCRLGREAPTAKSPGLTFGVGGKQTQNRPLNVACHQEGKVWSLQHVRLGNLEFLSFCSSTGGRSAETAFVAKKPQFQNLERPAGVCSPGNPFWMGGLSSSGISSPPGAKNLNGLPCGLPCCRVCRSLGLTLPKFSFPEPASFQMCRTSAPTIPRQLLVGRH